MTATPPPRCHCGIYLTVPHEHAQGVPKLSEPLRPLREFGENRAEALKLVDVFIVQGLLAQAGPDLYKLTERGVTHPSKALTALLSPPNDDGESHE